MKNERIDQTATENKRARLAKLKKEEEERLVKMQKLEKSIKEADNKIINARKYAAGEWVIKKIENGNEAVIKAMREYIDDSRKYFFPEVFTADEIKEANERAAQRRADSKLKRAKSI